MSDWWKSLTLDEKKEYIKKHPRSKKKAEVNRALEAKKRRLAEKYGKPLSPSLKKQAYNHLKNNPSATESIRVSLNDAQRRFEQKLQRMDGKQLKTFYDKTVRSVKSERSNVTKNIKQASLISGIVFVSAVALSVVLGIDLSTSVQYVAGGYGDSIREHTEKVENELEAMDAEEKAQKFQNKEEKIKYKQEKERRRRHLKMEYLRKVHEEQIRKAKENLKDPKIVADSLVTGVKHKKPEFEPERPTPVVNENTSNENNVEPEKASYKQTYSTINNKPCNLKETAMTSSIKKISIQSSHETDLLKALIKLEKIEIASSNSISKLLESIDHIEAVIPTTASIMVSSIGKPSIMNRAKLLLNKFNCELASRKVKLNELARKATLKKSPIDYHIKKNIPHSNYSFEKAYIDNEGKTELCEHHTLTEVKVETGSINKVEIYSFIKDNLIHISAVKGSHFTPKSFSVIKPRELASWLKENI